MGYDNEYKRRAGIAKQLDSQEFWKSTFLIAFNGTNPEEARRQADKCLREFNLKFNEQETAS